MFRIFAASCVLLICFVSPSASQDAPKAPPQVPPESLQNLQIHRVAPLYPPLARQARIQGTVTLRVVINKSGEVSDTQLVSGHPMLAPAAITAVKQWRYQPYMVDGEPVEIQTDIQVMFRLADNPPGTVEDISVGPVPGVVSGIIGGLPNYPGMERVPEAAMRPLRIQKIDPVYPGVAVQERIQGTVILDLQINSSGTVENVMRIGGHPTLAPAAIEAVKQWRYSPYVKDGKAIAVASVVHLNFALTDSGMAGVVSEPTPVEGSPSAPRTGRPLRVRVSSGVSQGLLLRKVTPEYPPDARAQSIQGIVVLHVNIDKEGNVNNVELISGHPLLAPAAIEAVRQWKYRPYLLNGDPVEVDTQVQVNFTLARE